MRNMSTDRVRRGQDEGVSIDSVRVGTDFLND